MSNKEKAQIVFEEELALIKSNHIKEFVLNCFDKLTPDYFWEVAASSSGKNHPKVTNREHGLIVHIKLCVWWGKELFASFYKTELDIIVAALLLHDLQKFGQGMTDGKPNLASCTSAHGPMLAMQMEQLYVESRQYRSCSPHIDTIIASVALHMGIWTNRSLGFKWQREYGEDEIVKIVHLADMVASRKSDSKMEELSKYEYPSDILKRKKLL